MYTAKNQYCEVFGGSMIESTVSVIVRRRWARPLFEIRWVAPRQRCHVFASREYFNVLWTIPGRIISVNGTCIIYVLKFIRKKDCFLTSRCARIEIDRVCKLVVANRDLEHRRWEKDGKRQSERRSIKERKSTTLSEEKRKLFVRENTWLLVTATENSDVAGVKD